MGPRADMPFSGKEPRGLGPEELQLLASIDDIAEGIAAVADKLPPAEAEDHIERELAMLAVKMGHYEGKSEIAKGSVGFAIDVCLRERIKARLAAGPESTGGG